MIASSRALQNRSLIRGRQGERFQGFVDRLEPPARRFLNGAVTNCFFLSVSSAKSSLIFASAPPLTASLQLVSLNEPGRIQKGVKAAFGSSV